MKKILFSYFAFLLLLIVSTSQLVLAQETWAPTSTGSNDPVGRGGQSAVWTGTKMIVWGGENNGNSTPLNSGGIYDPVVDTWTATSTSTNVPLPRYDHTALWTGIKMIIWGGRIISGPFNTGSIYDPLSDTWTAVSN